MGFFDFFKGKKENTESLNKGLEKTKESFLGKLTKAIVGKATIDDEVLDNLEEILIGADVGIDTTSKIIDKIQHRVAKDKYVNASELNAILKEEIYSIFAEKPSIENVLDQTQKPYVIMVVGVNGVGKTTTIGKLSNKFKLAGKDVVLGAADTFRAAAVEQLNIWATRVGVDIVKQQQGADPSAVAFDTVQ
ncbi:MAG: hypothetical protein RI955_325, partial [Bacteroidota bacterium]